MRKLHRWLEAYRLPSRLVQGSGGRRLKPLFRDSDELAAAPDLTAAVRAALADADFLIVICSPRSAQSKWVGREIELFRHLHGGQRILTALIEGDNETSFHPALLRRPHGRQTEPLAADFRPGMGGHRMAFLKLMAPLAGVGLDELIHRDGQRQVRQMGFAAAGGVAALAVVAGLGLAALNAKADADAQRRRAGTLGEFMATDLRKGLEAAGRHDLLDQVNRAALNSYKGENLSQLTPEQLEQRAKLLQGAGKDAEKRGDLTAAKAQVEAAYRISAALLAAKPKDPERIFVHAQSEFWLGFINWRAGNAAAARAGYEAYARLADRLVAADPANDNWRMEQVYAAHDLGALSLRQAGDPALAERYFRASLAELEPILRHKPDDLDALTERLQDLAWLADSQRLQGRLREATATRQEQAQVLKIMLSNSPRNFDVKRFILAHDLAVARIAMAEGKTAQATSLLEDGRKHAVAMQAEDPDNKDIPKQGRMFELFEARLWLDSPAPSRPPPERIANILGDCAPLGPSADSREISDFCGVLLARFLRQQGDLVGAETALVPVREHLAQQHDILTARWGLNLAAEARPVQLAQRGSR